MSLTTAFAQTDWTLSTVQIGLSLPTTFTPSATCFGPTFNLGYDNLNSTSGTYFLTVNFYEPCSPPGAASTGFITSALADAVLTTTTLPYYYGSCPSGYEIAAGGNVIDSGVASAGHVCCPSAPTASVGQITGHNIVDGGPHLYNCSRLATGPITLVSGSNTQVIGTTQPLSIVEQPIVVLSTSSLSLPSGITYTLGNSVGDQAYPLSVLEVVPSTTSDFRLPPSCLGPTYTTGVNGYDLVESGVVIQLNPACYPYAANLQGQTISSNGPPPLAASYASTVTSYAQFIYPGTCPSGFVMTASSVWTMSASNSYTAFSGGYCCPSGFTVSSWGSGYFCIHRPSTAVTIVDTRSTTTLRDGAIPTVTYLAFGVASTSRVIGFGDSAAPGQTASMASATGSSSSNSPQLSSGAAAGVGVGVTLAVLILGGLIAFLFWRRWRRSKNPPANTIDHEQGRDEKAELPGGGHESAIFEAPEKSKPYEADDRNVRAELEGDVAWEVPAEEVRRKEEVRAEVS